MGEGAAVYHLHAAGSDEGAPATRTTEVRILVGKDNVYVGVICFDSDPSKIIVSQARRDAP